MMATRILEGVDGQAAFFDGTTEIAFGPVFSGLNQAEHFLHWLPIDASHYEPADLLTEWGNYIKEHPVPCEEAGYECKGPVTEGQYGTLCKFHRDYYADVREAPCHSA